MFLQSAFIRKNTPELRKALEALGYKASFGNINNDSIATSSITNTYSCISMSIFDNENPHINWKANGKRIDCGDNVNMFLALAALRDDTDKHQCFVLDTNVSGLYDPNTLMSKGTFVICSRDKWVIDFLSDGTPSPYSSRNTPAHKATTEEIIEHFKK